MSGNQRSRGLIGALLVVMLALIVACGAAATAVPAVPEAATALAQPAVAAVPQPTSVAARTTAPVETSNAIGTLNIAYTEFR